MAGALVESKVANGRRWSWRIYQSVFARDRFTTVTSWRTCSTSCAYHKGNVSLSPAVTSTPYGSFDLLQSVEPYGVLLQSVEPYGVLVSLSLAVTSTPYGSADSSRSNARSRDS